MEKTAKAGGTLKHRFESIEFFSDDLAVTGGGLEGIAHIKIQVCEIRKNRETTV